MLGGGGEGEVGEGRWPEGSGSGGWGGGREGAELRRIYSLQLRHKPPTRNSLSV